MQGVWMGALPYHKGSAVRRAVGSAVRRADRWLWRWINPKSGKTKQIVFRILGRILGSIFRRVFRRSLGRRSLGWLNLNFCQPSEFLAKTPLSGATAITRREIKLSRIFMILSDLSRWSCRR